MPTDDHRELIANLSVMNAFPDQLRQRIAAVFEEVSESESLERDAYLIHMGDRSCDDGFILLKGSVAIRRRVSPPFKAEGPVLLGEMKQSNPNAERTADVTALEDIEVLRFDWDRFYALLKERLAPSEFAIFSRALQDYSWRHFLGDDI